MNEYWPVNIGVQCQRRQDRLPPFLAPSTFNQMKYIGLYPIMFQCEAGVAEGCSALNQLWVFYMSSINV